MTQTRTAGLLLAAILLTGCNMTDQGHDRPNQSTGPTTADPDGELVDGLPVPPLGTSQTIPGGHATLLSARWEAAPPDTAGHPLRGWWLICDIEIRAETAPVYVSTWDWVAMGAYTGETAGPKLWGNAYEASVTVPITVSMSGERMAFDPDPGQATIIQWNSDSTEGYVAAWLVPPKDGK